MPRLRRAKNKAIIASGRMVSVGGKQGQRYKPKAENWQEQCWMFYDTISEYHQAVTWIANIMSRAVLQIVDEGGKLVTDQAASDALADLYGGPDYQPEMLRLLAIHLTVAGDCYLIAEDEPGSSKTKWNVRKPSDVTLEGTNWRIGNRTIPASTVEVIRIWRPHPSKPSMADSPSRAVLPILTEIDGLTKHINAQIDSRLAGNGILFLPDDIDFSSQQVQVSDDGTEITQTPDGVQGFYDELVDTMDTAIKDPSSASAMSPLVAQVSGDSIKNIKHVTFWSPLQQASQTMRDAAVTRLALGMDMPPEALTGTGEMNHWGAWAVDEASIKIHAEPFLTVVTSSLTEGYLTPLLEAERSPQAGLWMFDADTADLRLRPNRSQEAFDLWDRGALSDATLRRETGFGEEDVPDAADFRTWLARKMILSGSPTPEMMNQVLTVLGFPIGDVDKQGTTAQEPGQPSPQQQGEPTPNARETTPGRSDRPVEPGPPDITDAAAAGTALVFRALERVGNKLRNSRAIARDTEGVMASRVYLSVNYPAEAIPVLLDGAWNQLGDEEFGQLSVPPQKLAKWLQAYTTRLLTEKLPYSMDSVAQFIRSEMALAGVDVTR